MLFYFSSLGIALNKGVPKNRSFWSLGHFRAFAGEKNQGVIGLLIDYGKFDWSQSHSMRWPSDYNSGEIIRVRLSQRRGRNFGRIHEVTFSRGVLSDWSSRKIFFRRRAVP